jgi:hypothetical protein
VIRIRSIIVKTDECCRDGYSADRQGAGKGKDGARDRGDLMNRLLAIGAALLLSACSENGDTSGSQPETGKDGNHIWKTQTDQIERSRDVENALQDSNAQQRQAIEEQTR